MVIIFRKQSYFEIYKQQTKDHISLRRYFLHYLVMCNVKLIAVFWMPKVLLPMTLRHMASGVAVIAANTPALLGNSRHPIALM